jgi:hypothetical protein
MTQEYLFDLSRNGLHLLHFGVPHFDALTECPPYRGADKSLARSGRKHATATEDLDFHIILFIITIGGMLVLFIYNRLAPNEIFSPSNKIHREVGRAKDLPAPLY